MPKYTPEQLREMAHEAICARNSGDPRYSFLMIGIAVRCELDPNEVDRRIVALAAA